MKDLQKIHVDQPDISDNTITFKDSNLGIPLQLNETFSYFLMRMHTSSEIYSCDKILILPKKQEQTNNEVKKLCTQVGTILRILEESTQWANWTLDLRLSNLPLVRLWDY